MSRLGGLIGVVVAVLATQPALGQPAPQPVPDDPIDALLRQAPKGVDPEEPDTAAAGTSQVAPEPALPAAPQPYAPRPRPTLTAPVYLEETGKSPDAPPSPADAAYDSRLRASMAAARSFQGPMDGGWTLSAGPHDLYALQLIDRGGTVEGAWRDLRRAGARDGSGFIDAVEHSGANLIFRFAGGAVATVRPVGDGRWSGQLSEGGRTESVNLRRRGP